MTGIGLRALALPGVIALCLLASACGGSSGPGVAQVGSTSSAGGTSTSAVTSPQQALLDFAACMRKHGVSGFPDPTLTASGTYGFGNLNDVRRLVRGKQPALTACLPILSKAGVTSTEHMNEFQADMLAYAKCMRGHGVADFPDPNANGRFGGRLKNLDRSTPAYASAATACRPELSKAIAVFSVAGSG